MSPGGTSVESIPIELVRTRTPDGVLLHGALTGRGAAEGLLGIHGAWGNFYGTPVVDLLPLADRFDLSVLSMNNRGHDLGSLGDGEPSIGQTRDLFEDAPRDLDTAVSVLRDAGARRSVCVAHSFGCHKSSYWMAQSRPPDIRGLVLLSPGPRLEATEKWFVDGRATHYVQMAEDAVAAGEPNRVIVLSSNAPIPMVAEAATIISIWGPDTRAVPEYHLPEVDVPVLVTIGRREPGVYRDKAAAVAASASNSELIELDDDHFYTRNRAGLIETVLDWIRRHELLDLVDRTDPTDTES